MTILIYLLIFLLPTQLGYHFWPSWSHLYGLRLDYLSPTFHLTDLFLIFLLFLNLKHLVRVRPMTWLVPIFLLATVNTITSLNPINSLLIWTRILLLINFALVVSRLKKPQLKSLFTFFSISVIAVSLLGMAQFLKQESLNGPFYYLGERHFNLSTPDIAKTISFPCRLFTDNCPLTLRPYATFSHPNSLAGYLLVSILILWILPSDLKPKKNLLYLTIILALITLLLTFSRSVFITLIILSPLLHPKISKKVINLKLIYLITTLVLVTTITLTLYPTTPNTDPSLAHRVQLNQSAITIIKNNPFFGVGLNNFIPALAKLSPTLDFRLLQPVHNIYLLLLSELGIVPALFLIFIVSKNLPRTKHSLLTSIPLLAILITSIFDHYWLTLPQNQLLLFLTLGLMYNQHTNNQIN